jgi:EipB-like
MRFLFTALSFFGVIVTAHAAPVVLTPHRAVYTLSLDEARGLRSPSKASGKIAYDFSGNACEGYTLTYRQVTVLEGSETGNRASDIQSSSFESGDGNELRVRTTVRRGTSLTALSAAETTEINAKRDGQTLRVSVIKPFPRRKEDKKEYVFQGAPYLPSQHLISLLEQAQAGNTTFTAPLYDGSGDGDTVYNTFAVLGKQRSLNNESRWPMTVSAFAPSGGEQTPQQILFYELDNGGIAHGLTLDYDAFKLKASLSTLERLPAKPCS